MDVFYVLLLLSISSNINAQNTINEDHNVALNEENDVMLKWRVDGDDIFFEMSAATTGYVAIGFSPNGGMPGADIVAGWVKNGRAYLSDRHATTYSRPVADASDDYELLYGYEENGKTTMAFKRKLNTCDDKDNIITSDTLRIIWAVNNADPMNLDDLMYHSNNRGVRSVVLLDAATSKISELPADAGFFDVTMPNVTVPDDKDTTYWCIAVDVPKFDQEVHVIRFDGIVQEGHESVVHHMVIYACYGNITAVRGWSLDCDSEIMPPDMSECLTIIYAWAIGAKSFEFPEHVGLPLGGEDGPTFLMIEMHYDNPAFSPDFHDNSGLRIYYTPTLREYSADIWMVGQNVDLMHLIPPNESAFKTYGFCFGDCTKAGMDEDVYVFAAMLHGHLAARQINLQQYRGDELIDELKDDNYDFNLQETRILATENTFKPGDSYVVTCTYNTVGRDEVTRGGDGTVQEMCLVFVYYYPKKTKIDYCMSTPSLASYWEFFNIPYVEGIEDYSVYTYSHVVNSDPETLRIGLQNVTDRAKRYNYCFGSTDLNLNEDHFELNFPEWFDPEKTMVAPDVCSVDDDDNDPIGRGNTLMAGCYSVITTIALCLLFV
ncbi:DBH-like monooxygenase protein 1 homolog [Antedon mediterranea]|uniref:DBH-like monooxygenase protein 1 homolog n=1 Tax=Antedon mediterranea TaxID=105859 RepID=UPI003AF5AD9C